MVGIFGKSGGALNKIGFYIGGLDNARTKLSNNLSFMEERGLFAAAAAAAAAAATTEEEEEEEVEEIEVAGTFSINHSQSRHPGRTNEGHSRPYQVLDYKGELERALDVSKDRLRTMKAKDDVPQSKAMQAVVEALLLLKSF